MLPKSIAIVLLIVVSLGFADAIRWSGDGGDNQWDNPDNWEEGRVPGANDDAYIPPGSPDCNMPEGNVSVGSISNSGTINASNSNISTNNFHNGSNAQVNASGNLTIEPKDDKKGFRFNNDGNMNCGDANVNIGKKPDPEDDPNDLGTNDANVSNNGVIEAGNLDMKGTNISNSGYLSGDNVSLDATNRVSNIVVDRAARIQAGDSESGEGGDVTISAENVDTSFGSVIQAGNSKNGKGGDVTIMCRGRLQHDGVVYSGEGKTPGHAYFCAKSCKGNGSINSEKPATSARAKATAQHNPGHISIHADSVELGGKLFSLWSNDLDIRGRIIRLFDIEGYGALEALGAFTLYNTADGHVDLSAIQDNDCLIGIGGIHIHTNDLKAPPAGIESLFFPNPQIHSADTSLHMARAFPFGALRRAATVDTLYLTLFNAGLGNRSIKAEITSTRGWAELVNENTAILKPFESDSLPIRIDIPEQTMRGTADTLLIRLFSGTKSDTCKGIITCSGKVPEIPLTLVSETQHSATVGTEFCDTLKATGGSPPYQWTITDSKPEWLSLDAQSGILSGTPSQSGVLTLSVNLSDANANTCGFTYSLNISAAAIIRSESLKPLRFELVQNHPNPFNAETEITYQIDKAGRVQVEVYDCLGKKVATLVDEHQTAGCYTIPFSAHFLSSGIYFYRLSMNNKTVVKKMMLIR